MKRLRCVRRSSGENQNIFGYPTDYIGNWDNSWAVDESQHTTHAWLHLGAEYISGNAHGDFVITDIYYKVLDRSCKSGYTPVCSWQANGTGSNGHGGHFWNTLCVRTEVCHGQQAVVDMFGLAGNDFHTPVTYCPRGQYRCAKRIGFWDVEGGIDSFGAIEGTTGHWNYALYTRKSNCKYNGRRQVADAGGMDQRQVAVSGIDQRQVAEAADASANVGAVEPKLLWVAVGLAAIMAIVAFVVVRRKRSASVYATLEEDTPLSVA